MSWSDYALGAFVLVCGASLYVFVGVLRAMVAALKGMSVQLTEQLDELIRTGESIARSVDAGNGDEHKRIGFALEKIEAALDRAATTIERGIRK